jgi:hypothetical protein
MSFGPRRFHCERCLGIAVVGLAVGEVLGFALVEVEDGLAVGEVLRGVVGVEGGLVVEEVRHGRVGTKPRHGRHHHKREILFLEIIKRAFSLTIMQLQLAGVTLFGGQYLSNN